MMAEILVISACAGGYCNPVYSAYTAQYPEFSQKIETIKKNAIRYVDYDFVKTTAPMAGFIIQKEATFGVGKDKSFSLNFKDSFKVKFTFGF